MQYKNLHSYKEFLNEKKNNEIVNESLVSWLKNLFKSLSKYANKVVQSKKIDALINDWIKEVDELFEKDLQNNVKNYATKILKKSNINVLETDEVDTETKVAESIGFRRLFEAEEKKDIETKVVTQKYKNPIDEAIGRFIEGKKKILYAKFPAEYENDEDGKPITGYGQEKNRLVLLYVQASLAKLEEHITKKKIEYYEKNKNIFTDEVTNKLVKDEAIKQKKVAENMKKFISEMDEEIEKKGEEPVEDYKVGDKVIYLLKDKTKEDWDKLSDDEKKDTENDKTKQVVASKEIKEIKDDKYIFELESGEKVEKNKNQIMSKYTEEKTESNEEEYKVGDEIEYESKKDKSKIFKNKVKEIKNDFVVVENEDGETFEIEKIRIKPKKEEEGEETTTEEETPTEEK